MPAKHVCPLCEEGVTREEVYCEEVKIGRKSLKIEGLRKSVCDSCGGESVFEDQLEFNAELIRSAINVDRGTVSVGMLRGLRDEWSLTQSDASLIFGAGSNSFAKWECKQSSLSTPTALLVRVALKFPEVVPYLASLCSYTLDEKSHGMKKYCAGAARLQGGYETVRLSVEDASNLVFVQHAPKHSRFTQDIDVGASWRRSSTWERAVA